MLISITNLSDLPQELRSWRGSGPWGEWLWSELTLFGSRLGASVLIFCVFWLASVVVKRIICRLDAAADPHKQDILNLLGQLIKISLLVFGAITAVGTLGVNVSAMVAGLGLTGFALGFAFRDALSNLLAGMLILIYHPFRRGDVIAVTGFEGTVIGIDLRYTTLQGEDKIFLIPNSTLFTNAISLTVSHASAKPSSPAAELSQGHLPSG